MAKTNEYVCKSMFMNLYGITRGKVDYLICKKKASLNGIIQPNVTGRQTPHNRNEAEEQQVIDHIESIPKYESHYSRRHTKKLYLSSRLNIAKLHELYCEKRKLENGKPVSYSAYARIFHSLGYKFKSPSIDTCKKCDQLRIQIEAETDEAKKEDLKTEKEAHLNAAELAYDMKKKDKLESKKNPDKMRMLCFDLQQCLPTPDLGSNIVYYKRQLWTYNFTIRDCTEDKTTCYMWHEAAGKRGSNEIATCLVDFLSKLPETVEHVIMYSDSCPGQNKNINVTAALSLCVSQSKTLETVEHKFLVPGHTRMNCDTDHAKIERAKKLATCEIRSPQEWYQLVRTIRGKKQFIVREMALEDFLNYSELIGTKLVRKKINIGGEQFNWHNLRWFKYTKDFGVVAYKEDLQDETPFKTMDLRKRSRGRPSEIRIGRLYITPLPIPVEKKKDLLSLLHLIDPIFHSFYQNLCTSANSTQHGDWAESDSEDDL